MKKALLIIIAAIFLSIVAMMPAEGTPVLDNLLWMGWTLAAGWIAVRLIVIVQWLHREEEKRRRA